MGPIGGFGGVGLTHEVFCSVEISNLPRRVYDPGAGFGSSDTYHVWVAHIADELPRRLT